jgi:hypothetical protein
VLLLAEAQAVAEAGSDAVSAPKETSPSSWGMAPIRSASTPFCPLVGSTGCGRFRFRLAGGAGGAGTFSDNHIRRSGL